MEITFAKEADIQGILNLQKQIYRVEKQSDFAEETLKSQLEDKSCDVLVAKTDGKVIGTAAVYYIQVALRARPYAFLEGLVIDKDTRGRGFGTQLFKKCIEIAKSKNCYKMLFTSGGDRADAHKFYEKLGFKKWGVEFRKDL